MAGGLLDHGHEHVAEVPGAPTGTEATAGALPTAAPMPDAPPVTTATRLLSSVGMCDILGVGNHLLVLAAQSESWVIPFVVLFGVPFGALGALLVHYSTDYVFDGEKRSPYAEDDAPHPLNVYGRSKLDGERRIAAAGCRALVLRASWVYSPARGKNFFSTIAARGNRW